MVWAVEVKYETKMILCSFQLLCQLCLSVLFGFRYLALTTFKMWETPYRCGHQMMAHPEIRPNILSQINRAWSCAVCFLLKHFRETPFTSWTESIINMRNFKRKVLFINCNLPVLKFQHLFQREKGGGAWKDVNKRSLRHISSLLQFMSLKHCQLVCVNSSLFSFQT